MAFRDRSQTRRKHLDLELYEHFLGIAPKDEERSEQKTILPAQKYFLLGATDFWTKDLDILAEVLRFEEQQFLRGIGRDGSPLRDGARFIAGRIEYAWSEKDKKAYSCRIFRTSEEEKALDGFLQEPKRKIPSDPSRCERRQSLDGKTAVACMYHGKCIHQYGGTVDAGQKSRYLCNEHL